MFEREISSLIVTADPTGEPVGIITKTGVIERSPDYRRVTSKYGDMTIIKTSVELHEHREQSRGVPVVLACIRLVTDRGYFMADG